MSRNHHSVLHVATRSNHLRCARDGLRTCTLQSRCLARCSSLGDVPHREGIVANQILQMAVYCGPSRLQNYVWLTHTSMCSKRSFRLSLVISLVIFHSSWKRFKGLDVVHRPVPRWRCMLWGAASVQHCYAPLRRASTACVILVLTRPVASYCRIGSNQPASSCRKRGTSLLILSLYQLRLGLIGVKGVTGV